MAVLGKSTPALGSHTPAMPSPGWKAGTRRRMPAASSRSCASPCAAARQGAAHQSPLGRADQWSPPVRISSRAPPRARASSHSAHACCTRGT